MNQLQAPEQVLFSSWGVQLHKLLLLWETPPSLSTEHISVPPLSLSPALKPPSAPPNLPCPLSALKPSSHHLDAGGFISSLDPELKGRDEILFHTITHSIPLDLAQGLFSGRCSNVGGSSEWTLFAFYLWLCRNQRKSHLSSQKREHIQIPRTAVPGKTF